MKTDEYGVKYSNNGRILYEFPNDLEGEYIIPEGVKEIKKYALDCKPSNVYPKLSSLRISKTVVKIGHSSGYKWLDSISIDKDNPVFDSREDCKAIIETKSNTLLYGCKHAFIPNGVKKIDLHAFDNAYAESKLFIPASVEEIHDLSFCSHQLIILKSMPLINFTTPEIIVMRLLTLILTPWYLVVHIHLYH